MIGIQTLACILLTVYYDIFLLRFIFITRIIIIKCWHFRDHLKRLLVKYLLIKKVTWSDIVLWLFFIANGILWYTLVMVTFTPSIRNDLCQVKGILTYKNTIHSKFVSHPTWDVFLLYKTAIKVPQIEKIATLNEYILKIWCILCRWSSSCSPLLHPVSLIVSDCNLVFFNIT